MPAESGPLVVIASSIWLSSSPRRGCRPGFLRWRPTIPHIRRPRSSALTVRVYAQETAFHCMGIVSRDGAPGQQPVMSMSPRRPRHRAPARRTDRRLATGWPFPRVRIARPRPGINLDTARRCVPREICQYAGRARGPLQDPDPDKRSSVVARIADLAEHSRTRPVPELGSRGAASGPGSGQGLEEALGTAIAARVREFRLQLGWTVGQLAAQSGLSKGMLSKIENAQASPSLATLARLSEALQVPVTAFFRGLNEEQDVMFVKAGRGLNIEHKGSGAGHRYESLGIMRAPSNTLEPLRVTLTERSNTFPLYQHAGTELIYMLSGRMEYGYGSARYLLESGDVLQFIGGVPHGPAALVELPIQFLSIKSITPST